MYHNVRYVLLIIAMSICLTSVALASVAQSKSADTPNTESEETARHNIPWLFTTHDEPSFTANILGHYKPQAITLIETNEDGWGLFEAGGKNHWVYIESHRIYINRPTPIFDNKGDSRSVGVVSPQAVRVIERDENWLLISTWMGEKWLNIDAIRSEVLLDIQPLNQRALGYPTGCEMIALAMMIHYESEADLTTLMSKMPRSRDPRLGFRGDPTTSNGFTILPPALLELTTEYMGNAIDMTGSSMDDLKVQLNLNRPIVVWINGKGFNVHAMCLTGYNETGFYYNDPWPGSKNTFITYERFYSMWNRPIVDQILGITYPTRMALSY